MLCFVVLLLGVCRVARTALFSDNWHLDLQTPDLLTDYLEVAYTHRHRRSGHLTSKERFGIRLSRLEELDATSNLLKKYTRNGMESQCKGTLFKAPFRKHYIPALSNRLRRNTISMKDYFTVPESCLLQSNTSSSKCKPITFRDTQIKTSVSVYQVNSWWRSQSLCFPECPTSHFQTPVFNNTIRLSYNISDWSWCSTASCSVVGKYLRLTFDVKYPKEGDDVKVAVNDTKFGTANQIPHCLTQYNRYAARLGQGLLSATNVSGFSWMTTGQLNQLCHKSYYIGYHGAGDDFKQFTFSNKGKNMRLRAAEYAGTSEGAAFLQTPGLQGPRYKNRQIQVVLPRDSELQYDILIDMNSAGSGSTQLSAAVFSVFCVTFL